MTSLAQFRVLDSGVRTDHPSHLSVHALQMALVERGAGVRWNGGGIARLLSRAMVKFDLQRAVLPASSARLFGIVMNLPARWIYPDAAWSRMVIYCFDCWEHEWDNWERFLSRNAFAQVFFSARQSAEELQRRLPGHRIAWMPEGIDPAPYDPSRPLAERGTDLLEFGRHSPQYNGLVADFCREKGFAHRYRQGPAWLFPTQDDLYRGLADAKLVVCLPRSITDPQEGRVDTMTMRYLEAIASGALILGQCPAEMNALFGYKPVIEIDWANPRQQLEAILGNISEYEPLRRRNLDRLMEIGTWRARATQIDQALAGLPD